MQGWNVWKYQLQYCQNLFLLSALLSYPSPPTPCWLPHSCHRTDQEHRTSGEDIPFPAVLGMLGQILPFPQVQSFLLNPFLLFHSDFLSVSHSKPCPGHKGQTRDKQSPLDINIIKQVGGRGRNMKMKNYRATQHYTWEKLNNILCLQTLFMNIFWYWILFLS